MDKFGIFKLLNSFFPSSDNNSSTNQQDKNSSADALSALLSSLSGKKPEQPDSPAPVPAAAKPTPPLQTKMISVMSSHDDFVKRVKEKHPVK